MTATDERCGYVASTEPPGAGTLPVERTGPLRGEGR